VSPNSLTISVAFTFIAFFLTAPSGIDSFQQDAVRLQKSLQYEVNVTLKLIQVIVTDKKGNPVTDLRKEEFVLTDNGEQKTLSEFETHILSLPPMEARAEQRSVPKPSISSPQLLGRKLFFLFDFVNTDPEGVYLARKAALRFVETSLQPTDEVGVISFSGKKEFQIPEFQTTDHSKVRRAIEAISLQDVLGVPIDYSPSFQSRENANYGGNIALSPSTESGERWVAHNFIWAMRALAQALRYVPGQKNIILLSHGISHRLMSIGFSGSMVGDLRDAYSKLGKELATSNVAVYPINTDPLWPPRPEPPTLRELASATGGQYLGHATNAPEHLEKIQTLTGTYYVLGYPIRETWDGKYHKIKVKVTRPDCEIHGQPGYLNPKPFTEYTDLEKQIQLVDLALASQPLFQMPVRFAMRSLVCAETPPDNIGFIAEIPLKKLGEVAGKKVEVISLAFNAADAVIDTRRIETNLASQKGEKVFIFSLLSVPSGTYKCRVVLRNTETGRAAVAADSTVVLERKEKDVLLYVPLLLIPYRGALWISENSVKGRPPILEKKFLFDPVQYVPYLDKSLKKNAEIWAAVRCALEKKDAAGLKLSAFLLDRSAGIQIPVLLDVLSEKEERGEKTFFVRLQIPDIESNPYILELVAENAATGASSRIGMNFIIE
jgi:VWFA-related protein